MPIAIAMAAIGQPLLGDGVSRAWARRALKRTPGVTATISHAVRRAGSQLNTSSARAAHLPAHSQVWPWRTPR